MYSKAEPPCYVNSDDEYEETDGIILKKFKEPSYATSAGFKKLTETKMKFDIIVYNKRLEEETWVSVTPMYGRLSYGEITDARPLGRAEESSPYDIPPLVFEEDTITDSSLITNENWLEKCGYVDYNDSDTKKVDKTGESLFCSVHKAALDSGKTLFPPTAKNFRSLVEMFYKKGVERKTSKSKENDPSEGMPDLVCGVEDGNDENVGDGDDDVQEISFEESVSMIAYSDVQKITKQLESICSKIEAHHNQVKEEEESNKAETKSETDEGQCKEEEEKKKVKQEEPQNSAKQEAVQKAKKPQQEQKPVAATTVQPKEVQTVSKIPQDVPKPAPKEAQSTSKPTPALQQKEPQQDAKPVSKDVKNVPQKEAKKMGKVSEASQIKTPLQKDKQPQKEAKTSLSKPASAPAQTSKKSEKLSAMAPQKNEKDNDAKNDSKEKKFMPVATNHERMKRCGSRECGQSWINEESEDRVLLTCTDRCRIVLHPKCSKKVEAVKIIEDPNSDKKSGIPCPTPSCTGKIARI